MPNLDEELQEHSDQDFQDVDQEPEVDQDEIDEEQRRQEELENFRQRQIRQQQQSSAQNQIKKIAEDQVKKQIKKSIWEAILATWEVWLGPVLIILGVIAIFALVVVIPPVICNSSYFDGLGTASAKGILTSTGICSAFKGQTASTANQAVVGGLDIVLTSAYRPGPPSADSRGETVDIALRNPIDPPGSTDPRIAELIQIIAGSGFVAPQGYIQNEYTNPSPGATAGHIHVQFNLKSDGTTYCDGTKVPNPPTDLVVIPSTIPMSGVSNPKLRQCMLTPVEAIFSAVGFSP